MLLPNKHSHPDRTVLAASTIALREIKKQKAVSFDELKTAVDKRVTGSDYLFTPAISLLYLLGLVEYLPTVDSFEYTGPK